ncbi:UMP kinase [Buchnera aphidicola str. APS (Acyrthosiphon pisum)]|uniref:Uridylate kinase n=2 Tax=Buchnera aphidicola TaxID=9 RepID=PYRH_BUCAI|nr:UMP kinase [Buchnera aphidicola]P57327.1 RecName: Full=Uridylate kinase; Short=UK; AltName: Full=Uridine monophosphate kinase; Short=UMP kinase; Short=UMPK [Buchnera aphidicola str. APS (Acyrthosiphon pisum)]pir/D84957/ uridylate kinase [imported] - Buchnera sp. (strain APS) [Buchnera sp. (in: enterobacteria)]ADP66629.1 uridylate kinase [Buchnera aphidicola str. TLW03 (Acyrthosiphon pisum)]OQX99847.1 MAG: UMP kinase [Erwiniaceae bacterium 4572_131]ACL30049.1 uridylate kinase [Buchnera aphid
MSTDKKFIYRRILLKISGEVLQGVNKFGIDINSLKRIAKEIEFIVKIGVQVGLVIGSGNLFRGAKLSKLGLNRVASDHIGILSTVINSLAMRDTINSISSIKTCLMSAIPLNGICEIYNYEKAMNLLSNHVVVIFSAGTGNPFFTTDSAACLRGIETESDIILKGTKVDGVYSKDPNKDSHAFLYRRLTYKDVLKKELKIMDLAAFTLARDYHMPIRVFNIHTPGSLYRIIMGDDEGTLITR